MFYDFITKYTDIFCWKNAKNFAVQKLLTFFQQKYWCIWDINIWNYNDTLSNDVLSFEQLGLDRKMFHLSTTLKINTGLQLLENLFGFQFSETEKLGNYAVGQGKNLKSQGIRK